VIQRIVFIKLAPEYADARRDVAAASREVLGAAPGVRSIFVGLPADDRTGREWDLSLHLRFADMDAVERYREHEVHRKYMDVFLRPMLDRIHVFNFTVDDDAP
jgi:hypothetical protein